MTDTKFTPGPWLAEYEDGEGTDWCVMVPEESPFGPYIASVHATWDHQEANAHLIAAAPELYEAAEEPERRLRACAENIRDEYPFWAHDLEEMADRLAEALAKARGEG